MPGQNSGNGPPRRNTEPDISSYFPPEKSYGQVELLARIDQEILRVEDGIVKLVMERAYLKRKRNSYSPAVNLPPELLSLVFGFACTPGSSELDQTYRQGDGLPGGMNLGLSVGSGAVTPLFLGSICNKWRRISRATSQLWSTVTIQMNNQRAELQAVLLQSWLSLSALRPLTVRIIEDDSAEGDNDDDWGIDVTSSAVIEVLAAYSQQWHTVDLFLPSTWKSTLSKIKHNLPMLTKVTLRGAESSPSMSRVDTFLLAPQLREVRLVGYSVVDIHLPWPQIRRLDGEDMGLDECFDTLRLGTQLHTCQFEQLWGASVPFIGQPIRHELLESFELILDSSRELHSLLEAITLPNLKEFVLSISDTRSLLRPLMPMLKRSACALQMVHLVGEMPSETELIEFLRQMPTLRVFIIINPVTETGGKLTQRFLNLMYPSKTDATNDDVAIDQAERFQETCLLPLLERLEYQGAVEFTPHALVELLAYRWRVDDTYSPTRRPHETRCTMDDHLSHNCQGRFIDGAIVHGSTDQIGPYVSQLRSFTLTTTKQMRFRSADSKIVKSLINEGMQLKFLDDPNAD